MYVNRATERALFWAPRALGLIFAVFLSLFALDVFGEGRGVGETLLALLMHLLPTFVVIAVLALAWRWEVAGGALFVAAAALFLAMSRGEGWVVSGPLLLVGALFLVCGWSRRRRRNPIID